MHKHATIIIAAGLMLATTTQALGQSDEPAARVSPYMGGPVELAKAPY